MLDDCKDCSALLKCSLTQQLTVVASVEFSGWVRVSFLSFH